MHRAFYYVKKSMKPVRSHAGDEFNTWSGVFLPREIQVSFIRKKYTVVTTLLDSSLESGELNDTRLFKSHALK